MILAPAASAQVPFVPSFQFGLGGGLNVPMGSIGDGTNNGYSVHGSVGYNMTPTFIVGAELGLFGNGGSDETIALLGPNGDFSMSSIQFTAMAKYKFPVSIHNMYAKGLMGGYRTASDVTSTLGNFELADTNFGFGFGGGFQFNGFKNSSIYTEGIYHRISGEIADAEFFTVNIGVLFSLN